MGMKVAIEVSETASGRRMNLIDIRTIFLARPNKTGIKYLQVIDGKPVAAFAEREIEIVECEPLGALTE